MALPLPRVVSDVGPGGPLVTAQNALYQNAIARAQAQYAPITTLADAASKMTYSNLMGPQYLAKLFGHPDVVANMTNDQQKNIPSQLANAGLGVSGSNAGGSNVGINALNQAFMQALSNANQSSQNPLTAIVNNVKNAFGIGDNSQNTGSQNALNNVPTNQGYPARAPQPSPALQNYYDQHPGAQTQVTSQLNPGSTTTLPSNQVATQPQERAVTTTNTATSTPSQDQNNQTYADRAGAQRGIIKQGEELGAKRAEAINKLGDQYVQDTEAMVPLQHLTQLVQTPTFMNMRKDIPGFQGIQLKTLANFGTPEQQRVIGDFITSAKTAVANTVNSFSGRAMAKEFDFGNMLKINENDNLGVIMGKLESLQTYKDATMQRNQIARNLMGAPNYMNEGDAYDQANKQVDMDKIRKNIAAQLQTPISIINKKTGEKKMVSPAEYNELLSQQNALNKK